MFLEVRDQRALSETGPLSVSIRWKHPSHEPHELLGLADAEITTGPHHPCFDDLFHTLGDLDVSGIDRSAYQDTNVRRNFRPFDYEVGSFTPL